MSATLRLRSAIALLPIALSLVAGCRSEIAGPREPAPSGQPALPEGQPVVVSSCPVGTMIGNGGTACAPVGPREPPEGFESVPGTWGFRAINAWGLCDKGLFSEIGTTRCPPVDPCNAPFPPAGATLVHDQGELLAALAGSGATIALADGTYAPITVQRAVKLVGGCGKRVVIRGDGPKLSAITVNGPFAVSVRSITFSDVEFGVWASAGASITVERAEFTNNECAAWIEQGAKLKMDRSLVAGARGAMADGVLVARGGHAEVTNTELRDMHVALQAFGQGSTATGSALVISDRSPEPMSPLVIASHGGRVDIDRSLIFANDSFIGGAEATDPRLAGSVPATLHISRSELLRVHPTEAGGFGVSGGSTLELVEDTFETRARVAISAETSANVSIERTVIRPLLVTDPADRGVGAGLVINDDVRLTIDGSAILGMSQSAVLAGKGCHIRVTGSLLGEVWEFTRTDFGKRFGSGQAISLSGNAVLEMTDSTLQNNAGSAIWMDRSGPSAKIERSVIIDTRDPEHSTTAVGLVAWSGTVDLRTTLIHGLPTAMAIGNASGAVSDTTVSKSDIAFRWIGESRLVASSDNGQRPLPGEILGRNNVIVESRAAEVEEPLPLGDCRCEKKK